MANRKSNNLMLFHGTSKKGLTGILKEGFINSAKICLGKGVYMTDCTCAALHNNYNYLNYSNHFLFLNEVIEPEKLQAFKFYLKRIKDNSNNPKHQSSS